MKIKVKFLTAFREVINKNEDEIQLPRISTIKELVAHLSEKYGRKFTKYLYSEVGLIAVNGISINSLQGFETKLKAADTVAFFPVLSGG